MIAAQVFPNLDAKRTRFLRFNGPARLGNLASTLLRAADQALVEEGSEIVYRMLLEAQLFLAWDDTARETGAITALAEMKLDLQRLQKSWSASEHWDPRLARYVADKCRAYSDKALALSGLLAE